MTQWAADHAGLPIDADYFDVHGLDALESGQEKTLASFTVPPQYNGLLVHFTQFLQRHPEDRRGSSIVDTTPIVWSIRVGGQRTDQYGEFRVLLNEWGRTSDFPIAIRIDEGKTIEMIARNLERDPRAHLVTVGGRLMGRIWYNRAYGGLT